ncbi:hypothetical protein ABT026_08465 [Streptomyces sp. NPDC002734]|uniref:hypothetical protein n=1 Tax=Streptomyces sp. NPDC002734 TaxID=3154426 RepID=UPI00331CB036
MMPRPSIDEAMGLLEAEVRAGRRAGACLDLEAAWEAFLRFGRQLFDVSDAPDGDGLLFQYGTYSFEGPPAFTVDLVRQFEIFDAEGDHAAFVQVHCEVRFDPEPALEALGSFTSWFFHDGGQDLDAWAREVTGRPAWAVACARTPTGVLVYQEGV